MRYARIYPWRRTRRFRAPSNGPEAFFVAQFSAGYTTNMFGFDLRQGQVTPVRLPPGRFRLATSPTSTGLDPKENTIGIVAVATLAASAPGVLSATITVT